MSVSSLPPPISSLTEVARRLAALEATVDQRFDLAGIEQKLDLILDAVKSNTDETSQNHVERISLVQEVAALKRWRADVEDMIHELGKSSLLDRVRRLEDVQRTALPDGK